MTKNPSDGTIHGVFSFPEQQPETPILFGIQELLLLPVTSFGMLLFPALPCGILKLMYYGE